MAYDSEEESEKSYGTNSVRNDSEESEEDDRSEVASEKDEVIDLEKSEELSEDSEGSEEPPSYNCLIKFEMDYDEKDKEGKQQEKKYQVNTTGNVREYMEVWYSDGTSIEALLRETLDRLEIVSTATGGWAGLRKFNQLGYCLKGDAKEAYDDIVDRNYPNDTDKTHINYEELCRDLITTLSDHVWTGDKMHTYVSNGISYVNCQMKDSSGRPAKPNMVLARMQRLRKMGKRMHHNRGVDFMTDAQFLQAYWNIFPQEMMDWLTNDQNIDPFEPGNHRTGPARRIGRRPGRPAIASCMC